MTETIPSDGTRRSSMRARAAAQAASLAVTALLVGGPLLFVYLRSSDPVWAVSGALLLFATAFVVFAVSPVGTLMSVFTMWAGYWVNSCPNCPAVSVDRVEWTFAECDACGDEIYEIRPVANEIRVERSSPGGPRRHFCSIECSEEGRS